MGVQVLLQAQPLSEALQTLHQRWSRLGRDKQVCSAQGLQGSNCQLLDVGWWRATCM